MVYPRSLLAPLKKQIDTREIVVLTGMRQVGKTTLLNMLFEQVTSDNKVFLDMENILVQKIFEEMDFENIWANLRPYGINPEQKAYIFIDEIQVKPEVTKAIRYLFDHYPVKFFITGSPSFYLKDLFPESLAGRKVTFDLFPLDFQEFLVFKGVERPTNELFSEKDRQKNLVAYERVKKMYDEYLYFGGFPRVVLTPDESQKKRILNDILVSYMEKDVRRLADFRRMDAFRDLILLLMQRLGSKLEITKLASEMELTRQTIYSYLSFLEATYVVFRIKPFTRNVDREISGTPKVYFCDTGLVQQFTSISEGRLLENAAYLNLRKYGRLMYYQRRSGREIDFILPDRNIAMEVKQRGTVHDIANLKKRAESIGMVESYVISRDFGSQKGLIPACDL